MVDEQKTQVDGKPRGRNALDDYFANQSGDDLGRALWTKVDDYKTFLWSSGRLALWQNLFESYYREYWNSASLTKSGNAGQYTHTTVNQFKSLIDRLQSIITQSRVKWQSRSVNGDSQSLQQAILSDSLLDYYLKQKNLSAMIADFVHWAWLIGESAIAVTWDAQKGKVYGHTKEGAEIREGDAHFEVFDPTCVVRDPSATSYDKCDWIITISRRSKWDEAAKYPELADDIVSMSIDRSDDDQWHFMPNWWAPSDDMIAVYHFYHKKTPACPDGRYAKFYASNLVVIEGSLPYEDIPVYRLAPQEHLGTPFGYSVSVNLLPTQQVYDMINDTIVTNHELYGVQSVAGVAGANTNWQNLANGATFIESEPMPGIDTTPKALNLLNTSPETYSYKKDLETTMEVLSGVNSVARGQPPEGVTAGTALALIQSMALQSNMTMQLKYTLALEQLGSGIIQILRTYAQIPRMAEIAGRDHRAYVKQFKAEDLDKVQRVFVELGNPLTDTVPGRLNLAESLVQAKLITTAKDYVTVLKTGDLDVMTDDTVAETLLIQRENEQMADGKAVPVLEFDQHDDHIRKHKAVLADPDSRTDANLVALVTAHINEHVKMKQTVDPALLQLLGVAPIAPPQPPPGMPGQPAPQPGPTAPGSIPGPAGPKPPAQPSAAPQSGGKPPSAAIVQPTPGAPAQKIPQAQPAVSPLAPKAPTK